MSTPNTLVSLVIVYWNTPHSLQHLLNQLREAPPEFEVIVVSNTQSLPVIDISHRPKRFRTIILPHNYGFAKACNLGWQASTAQYVLFLNPDVDISIPHVRALLTLAQDTNLPAVAPTLLNETHDADKKYAQPLPTWWNLLWQYSPLHRLGQWGILTTSQRTLPGGCLLIEKNLLEKIGGWDERFFIWFEDADLSLRLANLKIPYTITPLVKVPHLGGESFTELPENIKRQLFFNAFRQLAHKHFSKWQQWLLNVITSRFVQSTLLPADTSLQASVVVPNIDKEILTQFLKTNYHTFDFKNQELIVVTSALQLEPLKKVYSQVTWIELAHNKGFTATVNTGLKRARGNWIGTVNDDTILTKGWIDGLIHAASHSIHHSAKLGSISPAIIKPNGDVESLGIQVLPQGKALPITKPLPVGQVDAFNGAAVLLNRQAVAEVGFFDEKFGSYLEDIDLGLRMKRAGWEHMVLPQVKVVHFGQSTSQRFPRKKAWQDFGNWWRVTLKNFGPTHWLRYGVAILLERVRNLNGVLKAR